MTVFVPVASPVSCSSTATTIRFGIAEIVLRVLRPG
jgi:hypothetical protein